jgi:hypothetical protein
MRTGYAWLWRQLCQYDSLFRTSLVSRLASSLAKKCEEVSCMDSAHAGTLERSAGSIQGDPPQID